jgi:hypothetical protein
MDGWLQSIVWLVTSLALPWVGVSTPFVVLAALGPHRLWADTVWPWISEWVQTPGFGGAAAVAAAAIAFFGVRRQTRLNAWWQRAEWALTLLTRQGSTKKDRSVAIEAILALQDSRLAKRDEQVFLSGVVEAMSLNTLPADEVDIAQTDAADLPAGERRGAYWNEKARAEQEAADGPE